MYGERYKLMSRQTRGYYNIKYITFPVVFCTWSCGLGNHANRVRSVLFLFASAVQILQKCRHCTVRVVATTERTLNKCEQNIR